MTTKQTKSCSLCRVEKIIEEFPRQRSKPGGRASWCKVCHSSKSRAWRTKNADKAKETTRRWRANHPGWHRSSALGRRYGITPAQYEDLLRQQNGRCAICRCLAADSAKKFLCVDHVAGTLRIRGLLCSKCNWGIGMFNHNANLLESALRYLSRPHAMEGRRTRANREAA